MLPCRTTFWAKVLRALSRPCPQSPDTAILNLEALECRLTPSVNYYVSPSGNDNNNGRSPTAAWQTLDKVNSFTFAPGDTINFQGGATFYGSLQEIQSGTPSQPITYTSYNGRATINSGGSSAIAIYNTGNFVVSNLNLIGEGAGRGQSWGLQDYDTIAVSHLYFENLDVSGYGMAGISIYGTASSLIQDVQIVGCSVHDNGPSGDTTGSGGILVQGDYIPSLRAISGLVIDHTSVWNNEQQFGIYVSNVSGGVVQRSEVHDIFDPGESQGISAWNSDNIIFQNNESYDVFDATLVDGDGFFFGNGVYNSVMQYNYSHNNTSVGYDLVANLPGQAPSSGNTVRFNISENDGQQNPYGGGIIVSGDVFNTEAYNNTVYVTGDGLTPRCDFTVWNWTGTGLHIRNNILEAAPGDFLFKTNLNSTETDRDLLLQGNAYYEDDGSFQVFYLDHIFTDFSTWQNATGQEMLADGTPVGYQGNPQLIAPGQGGTIGNPDLLSSLAAYQLQGGSPLAQAGLDLLGTFGVDPGPEDFYGNPLSAGSGFSVGAYQFPSGTGPTVKMSRGLVAQTTQAVSAGGSVQETRIDPNLVALVDASFALNQKRETLTTIDSNESLGLNSF